MVASGLTVRRRARKVLSMTDERTLLWTDGPGLLALALLLPR